MPEVAMRLRQASRSRMMLSHYRSLAQWLWLASLFVALVLERGLQGAADSLRITSIQVPSAVANSSQVTLVCQYKLPRSDQLYSVVWYKNFIEFYRYQPPVELPAAVSSSQESQWKQEFKWAGINLDLAQSNSTHVHLQKVTLESEGTYMCEVSTQLFATTSMQRDMKVYVLPKQKLFVVDNTLPPGPSSSSSSPARQLNHSPDQQALAQLKQTSLIYNINDLVNLTCVAGPSRPAAQMRWLFNQVPVEANSKWLTYHQAPSSNQVGLVESRLTLAFQLQPNHLTRVTDKTQAGLVHEQLKLTCTSLLSASFSSETRVSLSNTKITSSLQSRHHQTNLYSPMPVPSSLLSDGQSQVSPLDKQTASVSSYPRYRWSQTRQQSNWRFNSRRRPTQAANSDDLSDNQDQTSSEELSNRDGHIFSTRPMVYRLPQWNNRELKAQIEFIDLLQRTSRPNELEAPQVEARSIAMNEQNYDSDTGILATPKLLGHRFTASNRDSPPTSNLNGDYQLNDRVQYTCKARVVDLNEANSTKSIYSLWFLNNKEVSSGIINGYNGDNFFHLESSQQESTKKDSNPSSSLDFYSQDAQYQPRSLSNRDKLLNSSPQQTNGTLTIDLTASIFQLPELNLKCQTRVEQPLIEFEHQVVLQVPPTQFIQSHPRSNRPYPKNYVPKWSSNGAHVSSKNTIHPGRESSSGGPRLHLKNLIVLLPVVVLFINWYMSGYFIYRL